MPPPTPPKLGAKPSLLDRLIDPEAAGTAIMTGDTPRKMYDAVLRDLEDLLNTRQTYRDLPDEFPEAKDSIANYGLPDLASLTPSTNQERKFVGDAIKAVIERFEPRLKNVKVTMLDPDMNLVKIALRFRVDARLAVDPSPDVSFDTILEMATGHYEVKPTAGT